MCGAVVCGVVFCSRSRACVCVCIRRTTSVRLTTKKRKKNARKNTASGVRFGHQRQRQAAMVVVGVVVDVAAWRCIRAIANEREITLVSRWGWGGRQIVECVVGEAQVCYVGGMMNYCKINYKTFIIDSGWNLYRNNIRNKAVSFS